jgi:hypothetical protein
MSQYRLTVREGPKVDREQFDDLDAAIEALRARAEEVLEGGPLPAVKAFRDFEPSRRVAARLEISTGGWMRGSDAGVDVMGDGEVIAFSGGMRRTPLEPDGEETPYEAVRRALAG